MQNACSATPIPPNSCACPARCCPGFQALAVIALAAGLVSWASACPPDYQQGMTVTIMFVHVPAAIVAESAYGLIAVASLFSLVWRHPLADTAARAAAPLGAVFTALGLITGSLWGRPMWGAYWVWDARLTSFLLLLFLYLGYMALWNAIEDETRAARAAAILALIGAVNLPIIKFSVDWWNTLHQGESILSRPDRAGLSVAAADHGAGLYAFVRRALDGPHPHRDPQPPGPQL